MHSRRDCEAKRPPVQLSEFSESVSGVKGATSQNGAPHAAKLLDQLRYCIRAIHYNLITFTHRTGLFLLGKMVYLFT
jgi:hypothetical protein